MLHDLWSSWKISTRYLGVCCCVLSMYMPPSNDEFCNSCLHIENRLPCLLKCDPDAIDSIDTCRQNHTGTSQKPNIPRADRFFDLFLCCPQQWLQQCYATLLGREHCYNCYATCVDVPASWESWPSDCHMSHVTSRMGGTPVLSPPGALPDG